MRDVIEPGTDVCLTFDEVCSFWHGITGVTHRDLMGMRAGNRSMVWAATGMGTTSTPWLAQQIRWQLVAKWRKAGIRVLAYM